MDDLKFRAALEIARAHKLRLADDPVLIYQRLNGVGWFYEPNTLRWLFVQRGGSMLFEPASDGWGWLPYFDKDLRRDLQGWVIIILLFSFPVVSCAGVVSGVVRSQPSIDMSDVWQQAYALVNAVWPIIGLPLSVGFTMSIMARMFVVLRDAMKP